MSKEGKGEGIKDRKYETSEANVTTRKKNEEKKEINEKEKSLPT